MTSKFVELTPNELFFGNAPKLQSARTGGLQNTAAASPVIMQPATIPTTNTSLIDQQEGTFVFTDMLWEYRKPIAIISILVVGGIWYAYSLKESEEKKRIG